VKARVRVRALGAPGAAEEQPDLLHGPAPRLDAPCGAATTVVVVGGAVEQVQRAAARRKAAAQAGHARPAALRRESRHER